MSKLPELIETTIRYYIYQSKWKSKQKLHIEYHSKVEIDPCPDDSLNNTLIWHGQGIYYPVFLCRADYTHNVCTHHYITGRRRFYRFTSALCWDSEKYVRIRRFFYSSGMNDPYSYSNNN